MKLLTTPALRLDGNFVASPNPSDLLYSHKWWFCYREVLQLFGVPETVEKIWFEFHDHPAENRYKVEYLETTVANDAQVRFDDDLVRLVSGYTARLIIKKTKRNMCYAECHYEDRDAA